MNIKKACDRLVKWLLIAFTVFFLLVTVSCAAQRLQGRQTPMIFGWGSAIVMTGSMEPNVPVGSLVFIQAADDYGTGDIITYEDSTGRSVTHRIVSISDGLVIAQGDANNTADKPFTGDRIAGKVQHILPHVGSILLRLQGPAGIAILILALLLLNVPSLISKRKEQAEHE